MKISEALSGSVDENLQFHDKLQKVHESHEKNKAYNPSCGWSVICQSSNGSQQHVKVS
jgi:hypothetical protein